MKKLIDYVVSQMNYQEQIELTLLEDNCIDYPECELSLMELEQFKQQMISKYLMKELYNG